MADDQELAAIRTKRMQELQQMQGQQQKQEESAAQQQNMINGVLNQVLDQQARARLNTILVAKPEKGKQLESFILQMATSGQLGGKMSENDLIGILERISAQTQKKLTVNDLCLSLLSSSTMSCSQLWEVAKSRLLTLFRSNDSRGMLDLLSPKDVHFDRSFSEHVPASDEGADEEDNVSLLQNVLRRSMGTHSPRRVPDWDPLWLWFRPSLCCLEAIGDRLREVGVTAISSVGCGTGLLEFLLGQIEGIHVVGYEVNESWWASSFAPPTFVRHSYVNGDAGPPPNVPQSHALMFCYFNDEDSFHKYLSRFEGRCLIVVGSLAEDTRTSPHPLALVGSNSLWRLVSLHCQTNGDVIAFYENKK